VVSRTEQSADHALWRILEVTRQLSAPTDLDTLLQQVIDAARDLLEADRGTVFLYDDKTDELYAQVATGAKEIRFPATVGIAGECAQSRRIVRVDDCYADNRFNQEIDKKTGYRTRCLLTVPLVGHDDKLVGVLQLLNKGVDDCFDEEDEQLALALAAQCAVVLQRAVLIEEHLVKQKMERDLALAREIQSRVLPETLPTIEGYEMAGWSDPADETGGDIFDVIKVDDAKALLLMGDATGHGIGPALSVTQVRAMVRIAARLKADLNDITLHVNSQLSDDLPSNRFVTAFLGELDAANHRVHYHAAGQGPLLHFHAGTGECEWLDASTFPMGIMPDLPMDEQPVFDLEPGDIVGLMSDGIFEYADPDNEQFMEKRAGEVVKAHHQESMDALIDHIRAAVREFARGAPQMDDMTIVLIKRSV
jgi:sigma-B regulation protein RsbU (phosphoserine phosphatase)